MRLLRGTLARRVLMFISNSLVKIKNVVVCVVCRDFCGVLFFLEDPLCCGFFFLFALRCGLFFFFYFALWVSILAPSPSPKKKKCGHAFK